MVKKGTALPDYSKQFANFGSLPLDVVARIFFYLSEWRDLNAASLVCKHFSEAIHRYDFFSGSLNRPKPWCTYSHCKVDRWAEAVGEGELRQVQLYLLGPAGAGKTALANQYVMRMFVDEYDPTCEPSYRKQLSLEEQVVLVELVDWFPHPWGDRPVPAWYLKAMEDADAFLFVYDVSSRDSMDDARTLYNEQIAQSLRAPVILVGNKCDLVDQRIVTEEEGREFAAQIDAGFFETSAKTAAQVDELIHDAIRHAFAARLIPAEAELHRDKKCTMF